MSPRKFIPVEVRFKDGEIGVGRAEWVNAAWICRCDDPAPLHGRCIPTSRPPVTICPRCERRYEVIPGDHMLQMVVREITPGTEPKPQHTSRDDA